MFEKITPEQAGISSHRVRRFMEQLEDAGMPMHSILLAKGNSLFAECYFAPFTADFCHRMYSQTKSYVGIAIGLLAEEGKLSLDDPIVKFFPDKIERPVPPELARQTVRDMLTMRTGVGALNWFYSAGLDRTHEYLNAGMIMRIPGTVWEYDSAGSQVLSSLVERLAGKSLFDYLTEKVFCHLGTFKTATILKTPNGDSWGDSALVCRPRDMLSFGRLLMQGGEWEGKQILPRDYVREATSPVASNVACGFNTCNARGYGYQIWSDGPEGFSFHGMGSQFTVCRPQKDFCLVCTADTQGHPYAYGVLFSAIAELLKDMQDAPLAADPAAEEELAAYISTRKLMAAVGEKESPTAAEIDGKEFICRENKSGITRFSLRFEGEEGVLSYTNAQGNKELRFGMCENHFGKFPQYGYSDGVGKTREWNGFLYDCATSAAWIEERKLLLRAQVIDRYFGNLTAIFSFTKQGECVLYLEKHAEHFMDEYQGTVIAEAAPL